ncbi:MAG: anti-sigma factor family protein [Micromonosporaceae bacterium]
MGDRLSALVDGELSHTERDRVHVHLAACPECRAEAAALRALKRRLGALSDAAMDGQLLNRLLALAEPGEPVPARPHPFPGSEAPRPALLMYTDSTHPPGRQDRIQGHRSGRQLRPAGRRRAPYMVAGVFSALVLGVGGVSFLAGGGQSSPGPSVTPPVGMFTVEHSVTTGEVPFAVPSASLVPAGTGRRGGP